MPGNHNASEKEEIWDRLIHSRTNDKRLSGLVKFQPVHLVKIQPVRTVQALLTAPDPGTLYGRRDRVLLQLLYNTGARVSELIGKADKGLNR